MSQQSQSQGLPDLNVEPVELCPGFSVAEADIVIRAVYRQVLGNAHVMESERLEVPESQLKRGELSVREFIRCIAKSELYRTRFFDSCYRYRSIELNFKHLLGRAPTSFEEMKFHSTILDEVGFEADIDSYLDSDEYQQAFGETLVPYYRGINTQVGQPAVGFTNTLELLRSASSSDQNPMAGNPPQLLNALMMTYPHSIGQSRDAKDILRKVFRPKQDDRAAIAASAAAERVLKQTIQKQAQHIADLEQLLADIRPAAMLGAMQIKR
ncbi:MAG: phycobilisome linker polypeptide [Leptolyngbya sp. SIOISBB]|nr:phycobilisome linker polypeptide [Leptolyngbya sp. SIOISBB]